MKESNTKEKYFNERVRARVREVQLKAKVVITQNQPEHENKGLAINSKNKTRNK